MYIKRKDRQCEARVLGVTEDNRVLVEARWNKGKNVNIVYLSEDYFTRKYGALPK